MSTPQNYAAHVWYHSIQVWLMGESSCSSHPTKGLHGLSHSWCIEKDRKISLSELKVGGAKLCVNREAVRHLCLSRRINFQLKFRFQREGTPYLKPLAGISVTKSGKFLDFGQLLKPLAAINLPKSHTFLGKFCKGDKIFHFSSEIILGQLL